MLEEKKLEIVGKEYYELYPVTKECQLSEFTATIPGLRNRWKLGYGFYEFTKPEFISYDKQVILMAKVYRSIYTLMIKNAKLCMRFYMTLCFSG